ncbi:hypothetical protein C5S39_01515 [Candidatus Methanophagaceae archaeon]|jgi:hypothetical protein|nr:hypothetical protein C5S39_01515 [Methanophagales archaeon]
MSKYTQEIRDFINEPRKQFNLLKNPKFWNQLCSSLDVIGDSDLAIDAYINSEFGKDDGEKYLSLYGVLQALFLQQDAVTNLCESLGLKNNLIANPKLKEIRDIRNDSIGHPTKRGNYKSYHFISRITIEKFGFQLISDYENNKTTIRDISVIDLIKEQRKDLSEILKKVINDLQAEEKAHKEMFKMEKLEAVFPDTLSYYIGKIFENIGKPDRAPLGQGNVKLVKKVMGKLKEALQKRGIELGTYDSINYVYDLLEYPITELEQYFDWLIAKKKPRINDKTAYIFAYFISEHLSKLKEIAKGIDDEYSS